MVKVAPWTSLLLASREHHAPPSPEPYLFVA
jgi:hypothetical protein